MKLHADIIFSDFMFLTFCHWGRVLRSRFQFVWMTDVEVASGIILSSVETPFVFVLNPESHVYYLPTFTSPSNLTLDVMTDFLDGVVEGKYVVSYLCVLCEFNCVKLVSEV